MAYLGELLADLAVDVVGGVLDVLRRQVVREVEESLKEARLALSDPDEDPDAPQPAFC